MPDREERFRVMLDMVEATVGPESRMLDLACGTGSITARALRRFPKARITGVDLDPALLTIARGHFAADARAEFVTADLRDADWADRLPHRSLRRGAHRHRPALDAHRAAGRALRAARRARAGGRGVHERRPHAGRVDAAHQRGRAAPSTARGASGPRRPARWTGRPGGARSGGRRAGRTAAERFGIFGRPEDGDHPSEEVQSPTGTPARCATAVSPRRARCGARRGTRSCWRCAENTPEGARAHRTAPPHAARGSAPGDALGAGRRGDRRGDGRCDPLVERRRDDVLRAQLVGRPRPPVPRRPRASCPR